MIALRAGSNWREERIDPHALGALIAGDLAASREIARLTGTFEDCQLVLRQGQHSHTLITEVGESFALLVQVNHDTPLGWARMLTQETARQLAQAAKPMQAPPKTLDVHPDELTNLLNDSLDSMWKEGSDVR